MPKITFYENDNTGAKYLGDDIVVYVPGNEAIIGAKDSNNCILLTSAATLDTETNLAKNPFVYNLLNNNLQVLYQEIVNVDDVPTPTSIENTFDYLEDKNSYDIKFITLGTLTDQFINYDGSTLTIPDIVSDLSEVCFNRKDCVLITTALIENSEIKAFKDALDTQTSLGIKAEYTGLFVTDTISYAAEGSNALIIKDPSLAYLIQYAKAVTGGKKWDAIAGVNRGVVKDYYSGDVVSKYTLDNNIFTDNGYSFNAISIVRPYDECIWGDRTLYKNTQGEGLKASSFLSIRNMVCDITKRCYYSAINNTYETNNEITWSNFKATITELLDQMVAGYNLADYKIIKKPTKKRATIECAIHLTPIEPVEDFDIYIELNNVETNVDPRLA